MMFRTLSVKDVSPYLCSFWFDYSLLHSVETDLIHLKTHNLSEPMNVTEECCLVTLFTYRKCCKESPFNTFNKSHVEKTISTYWAPYPVQSIINCILLPLLNIRIVCWIFKYSSSTVMVKWSIWNVLQDFDPYGFM